MISFMTVAEFERWSLTRNWGQSQRARLAQQFRNFVIHPYDRALCRTWAEVTDRSRRVGHTIHCADAWVAATAVFYKLPLITHNSKDYTGLQELEIISEASRGNRQS